MRVVVGLAPLPLDAQRRLGARHPGHHEREGEPHPRGPRARRRRRSTRRCSRRGAPTTTASTTSTGILTRTGSDQNGNRLPASDRPSGCRIPKNPFPNDRRAIAEAFAQDASWAFARTGDRLPQVYPVAGAVLPLIRVSNRRCGQGRGRTADLPLFRRSLVPTELPGRGRCRSTDRSGATQTGLEPATFAVTGRRANQLRHWAKLVLPVKRTPNGIRTRVAALKGRSPRPLDDGDSDRRDHPGRAPTVRWERGQA